MGKSGNRSRDDLWLRRGCVARPRHCVERLRKIEQVASRASCIASYGTISGTKMPPLHRLARRKFGMATKTDGDRVTGRFSPSDDASMLRRPASDSLDDLGDFVSLSVLTFQETVRLIGTGSDKLLRLFIELQHGAEFDLAAAEI